MMTPQTILKQFYSPRDKWAHKGDFGCVLIVAGSWRYAGSAYFNAMAALRSGADLTTIVGHERAMNIVGSMSPDLITYPLKNGLNLESVAIVEKLSQKCHALILGSGMEPNAISDKALLKIIQTAKLPMVLDAQAIRATAKNKNLLKDKRALLTPHAGEFLALTGENVTNHLETRKTLVKKWAAKLRATILLKGYIDVISDGKTVTFNKTGTPYMSKGGFGDCLAGICGALLARGASPMQAATAAAYLNGRAGERAAKDLHEGLLASEALTYIPQVLKSR